MKKIYVLFSLLFVSLAAYSQCFVQYQSTPCTCFGLCNGTATAMPGGGTPPYTYSWNNGQTTQTATGLCAGSYFCVVVDAMGNTCASTSGANVSQPTQVQAVATGQNPTSCINCNGMVSGTASGGTPGYTYLWSPSGCTTQTCTGLCSGTYTFTVTDANGCTGSAIVTLTAPGAPMVTTSTTPATQPNCNNGTATANVSNPGTYSYTWTPGGQTTQTATGLSTGSYTVCVMNVSNGCSTCVGVTINCVTGIEETNIEGSVSVYPNPSSGLFVIETSNLLNTYLEVTNVLGSIVYSTEIKADKTTIDLSGAGKGVYFMRAGNVVQKIIIE